MPWDRWQKVDQCDRVPPEVSKKGSIQIQSIAKLFRKHLLWKHAGTSTAVVPWNCIKSSDSACSKKQWHCWSTSMTVTSFFWNTISSRSQTTMIRSDSRSIVPFISPRYKAHQKKTHEAKHHEGAGQRQYLCQVNQVRLSSNWKPLLFKWEKIQIVEVDRKGLTTVKTSKSKQYNKWRQNNSQ